jgi:hypothetical protein
MSWLSRSVIARVVQAGFFLIGWCCVAADIQRAIRPALQAMDSGRMLQNITVLASDEFAGRAPGTLGEDRTIAFLTEQFRALGLKPGNPDGSWVQNVPMVGITAEKPRTRFNARDAEVSLAFPNESVIWSKRFVPEVEVKDSEVVFAGCGVVAPEYEWDDFKDVDVRGKTLLYHQ